MASWDAMAAENQVRLTGGLTAGQSNVLTFDSHIVLNYREAHSSIAFQLPRCCDATDECGCWARFTEYAHRIVDSGICINQRSVP